MGVSNIPGKLIVSATDFQRALSSAISTAGKKEPDDAIQLRIEPCDGEGPLRFYTVDRQANVNIEVLLWAEYVDLSDADDTVMEISVPEARALAAMKVQAGDSDMPPRVGLLITSEHITRTDESGIGLGIRQVRVRRMTKPHDDLSLGRPDRAIATTSDRITLERAPQLTPIQLAKISKAAQAIGTPLRFLSSGEEGEQIHVFAIGDGLMVSAVEASNTDQHEDLTEASQYLVDNITDVDTKTNTITITANPTGGIA